ncbi:uncharacterized protein PV07_00565 [Cladophialophora immunda]|uniref:Uncharacterized protein n=1 Tax=Cladophialophora immunda TaxID=569365 RepID=A0A0D2CV21_9EURO|nr:uncharacterized protein PV07_00565 [Cladophialophora immunda]KIW33740.1 hypothetical protein PV07_00565 [Cladophialophora immunda]
MQYRRIILEQRRKCSEDKDGKQQRGQELNPDWAVTGAATRTSLSLKAAVAPRRRSIFSRQGVALVPCRQSLDRRVKLQGIKDHASPIVRLPYSYAAWTSGFPPLCCRITHSKHLWLERSRCVCI